MHKLAAWLVAQLPKVDNDQAASPCVVVIDACHTTARQRLETENALNAALTKAQGNADYPYYPNFTYACMPRVNLETLVDRFARRTADGSGVEHHFSPARMGMLRGIEALRQDLADYEPPDYLQVVPADEALTLVKVFAPNCTPSVCPQPPAAPQKPVKVVYSGIGVLLQPAEFGCTADSHTASDESGNTICTRGKFHGTHITHHFGPGNPLAEGTPCTLHCIGEYKEANPDGTVKVWGLLVRYNLPGEDASVQHSGHITLFCDEHTPPKYSNEALSKGVVMYSEPRVLGGYTGCWKR